MHDWGNYPGDRVADLHVSHAVGDYEEHVSRKIDPIPVDPPSPKEADELRKMLKVLFDFLMDGELYHYSNTTNNKLNCALTDTNLVLHGKPTKYYK